MRLYLSSFRIGNASDSLPTLLGNGRRTAVIANAADAYTEEIRADVVANELEALEGIGLSPEELDLRHYFGRHDIKSTLAVYDLIWMRGGNTFVLRHALAKSGADRALVTLLQADGAVYGGYSAGVCVLAPTLRGLEVVDDPGWATALYDSEPIWEGLGILTYCVVPHVDSPSHPENQACEELAARYHKTGVLFQALRDGEVLVVNGSQTHVLGEPPCSLWGRQSNSRRLVGPSTVIQQGPPETSRWVLFARRSPEPASWTRQFGPD